MDPIWVWDVFSIPCRYNPSKEANSWIYQYVEFRFSKKPQLIKNASTDPTLPTLYDIPLNLHNRYPLCVLEVLFGGKSSFVVRP